MDQKYKCSLLKCLFPQYFFFLIAESTTPLTTTMIFSNYALDPMVTTASITGKSW